MKRGGGNFDKLAVYWPLRQDSACWNWLKLNKLFRKLEYIWKMKRNFDYVWTIKGRSRLIQLLSRQSAHRHKETKNIPQTAAIPTKAGIRYLKEKFRT